MQVKVSKSRYWQGKVLSWGSRKEPASSSFLPSGGGCRLSSAYGPILRLHSGQHLPSLSLIMTLFPSSHLLLWLWSSCLSLTRTFVITLGPPGKIFPLRKITDHGSWGFGHGHLWGIIQLITIIYTFLSGLEELMA